MGTNFYVRGFRRSDDPEHHIGKRSAAGGYCWDCKITLCKDGESGIHYGRSDWYDSCPKCDAKRAEEGLENSAAGRELGFNKNAPTAKRGVSSCSSFSWGMTTVQFNSILETPNTVCCSCDRPYDDKEKIIEDEYGRTYTKEEFLKGVLAECPVQYWEHVGKYFS
jgi:hypothetical protein